MRAAADCIRAAASYWVYTAVQVMLSSGAGLDMATIGSLARTMAPADGIAPIAGQVEYRWPISPAEERDHAPDDEDILALLGAGDLRDASRILAMTTLAAELRVAYQVAAAMTAWAGNACLARVLGEAAAGTSRTSSFLGERYRRIARRRGAKKAVVAVGRSTLVIIWHFPRDPLGEVGDSNPRIWLIHHGSKVATPACTMPQRGLPQTWAAPGTSSCSRTQPPPHRPIRLMILESVCLELEGVGVLCDVADLVVGVAVGLARGDLDTDFQVNALGCSEMLDDFLR